MIYVFGLAAVFSAGVYVFLLGCGLVPVPEALTYSKRTAALGLLLIILSLDTCAVWFYFQTPTPQQALRMAATDAVAFAAAFIMHRRVHFPQTVNEQLVL